ncbi:unnamed protein product [Cunninghamella echinulata]
MLNHVEYVLHPTFNNPYRNVKHEPYTLKEVGWGQFDLRIILNFTDGFAPKEAILFFVNFEQPRYQKIHKIEFHNLSVDWIHFLESLQAVSRESQKGSKKLPVNHSTNNHNSTTNQHESNYSDDDDDEALSSPPSSPPQSIPVLSPTSDALTPHQDFDEISPLSEDQELNGNGNEDEDLSDKDVIEDEVLNVDDLKHINSIHYMEHDHETCQVWDIPDHFNMVELARRLSLLSESQAERIHHIIQKYKNNAMSIEEKDDYFTLDLYSLGSTILNQLWAYTETIFGNDDG